MSKRGYWQKSIYIKKGNEGYWSKWGGGRRFIEQEELSIWACQACGEEQLDIFPEFLVDIGNNELVRICVFCRHIARLHGLNTYEQIIQKVRKPDMLALIANLATLPLRF